MTAAKTIEELIHEASDELTNAGYHEVQLAKAAGNVAEWEARRQDHFRQAVAHKTRFAELVEEIRRVNGDVNVFGGPAQAGA